MYFSSLRQIFTGNLETSTIASLALNCQYKRPEINVSTMNPFSTIQQCLLLSTIILSACNTGGESQALNWALSDPILLPGLPGTFDEVAVKDPSMLYFEGKWHVFYTARSNEEYTTGYVSAEELTDLQSAPRNELGMIRGNTRYGCAPQILFFEPQQQWYLIFQNRDANYQPAYSTTTSLSKPGSWKSPTPLIRKDHNAKWIDFWVICDKTRAYLFYTQAHDSVIVRSTRLENFPMGWGEPKTVLKEVHEAVHVYKAKDLDEYHLIYELNTANVRSFGLAVAPALSGPWKKVSNRYASGDQLQHIGKVANWTDMVSHGEAIRTGFNQEMEYDPENCRWLIQGIRVEEAQGDYSALPWKLGVIERQGVRDGQKSDSGHILR